MNDNNQSSRSPRRASRRPNMRRTANDSFPVSRPVRTEIQDRQRSDTRSNGSSAPRRGTVRAASPGGGSRMRQGGNSRGGYAEKRIPLFYLIYASVIVLVLAALAVGVSALRSFLTEYESAQPIHVAQDVFNTYFADTDYSKLTQYFTPADYTQQYGYESDSATISAMNACVKGKKTAFFKAATDLDDRIEYSVTCDGVKIATIVLTQSDQTTKRGYVLYKLDSIKLYDVIGYSRSLDPDTPEDPEITFTAVAPASYRIKVDGTELTEEQITKSFFDTETLRNMPSDYAGIPYTEYSWKSTELPDSVTATDSNGDACDAEYDEDKRVFTFAFVYNKELEQEYSSYAIEAAQKLAAYMQAGLRFDDISKYYDPSAKLYSETRAIGADAWMVNKYDSMEFKDVSCGEFYQYSETSFACRVSMIQIGHRAGYADSTDPIDYTFFFRLVDGKYLMYERYNN